MLKVGDKVRVIKPNDPNAYPTFVYEMEPSIGTTGIVTKLEWSPGENCPYLVKLDNGGWLYHPEWLEKVNKRKIYYASR